MIQIARADDMTTTIGKYKPRNLSDCGCVSGAAAKRYIDACDYRANNEYWLFAAEALEAGPLPMNGTIVDLGCGPGTLCNCMCFFGVKAKVIGLDASPEMIQHAKGTYPACEFRMGRAEMLPFADDSVDLLVSLNTLHHLIDIEGTATEIFRVLKPGGRAYLGDLKRNSSSDALNEKRARMKTEILEDFNRSIESAFTIEEVREVFAVLPAEHLSVGDCKAPPPKPANFTDPFGHENDWELYYRIAFSKGILH